MKKQIVSTLLALCMLLCLMPTAAFAEESTETPPVCSCETACTTDNMNKECPVCGAEKAIPQNCGQYIPVEDRTGENGSTERADDPNGSIELSAADQVQAMIDGLPNAEEITEDNAEEVKAQLEAIDEAKETLSDEEIDELDMTLFVFYSACLICFFIAYSEKKPRWYYLAYAFAGLSVLTKGPIGLLQPGLIILLFLFWRRDLKALLHIKLISGMLLFLAITLLWYGPMYALHGSDFVSQFIGVHNILRATVSEHPQYNVWYYYSAIFLAGFVPWVFTLPLAWHEYGMSRKVLTVFREKRIHLLVFSMKAQFLIVWAATIFVTYQLMATKYMTYTFPYMIPIAIGFASYLKKHDRLVLNMAGIVLAIYVAVTCTAIVPQCRQASAYEAAQFVSGLADSETTVVTYGGRYPVSLTYYSGHPAYRLAEGKDIARMLPGGISWNAKNVMPFMAIEDVANHQKVLAVVRDRDEARFLQDVPGNWQWRTQKGTWSVYQKSSDL